MKGCKYIFRSFIHINIRILPCLGVTGVRTWSTEGGGQEKEEEMSK